MNQPLQFQGIYSNFLTIFYQGRLTVELELVLTSISQITLNTMFPYICKHCKPFQIIQVCQEPDLQNYHTVANYRSTRVWEGGGGGVI